MAYASPTCIVRRMDFSTPYVYNDWLEVHTDRVSGELQASFVAVGALYSEVLKGIHNNDDKRFHERKREDERLNRSHLHMQKPHKTNFHRPMWG